MRNDVSYLTNLPYKDDCPLYFYLSSPNPPVHFSETVAPISLKVTDVITDLTGWFLSLCQSIPVFWGLFH